MQFPGYILTSNKRGRRVSKNVEKRVSAISFVSRVIKLETKPIVQFIALSSEQILAAWGGMIGFSAMQLGAIIREHTIIL